MAAIRNFLINKANQKVFETDSFTDISELHQYFITPKRFEKDFIDKYEAMNEILDCYSDLRTLAEQECVRLSSVQVYSRKNELPLSLETVTSYFEERKCSDEPPTRLITRIAQENFHTVYTLVNGMHKVLQRKRALVKLDRVQQQDAQCVRWLIRQPGRNSIERAGNRQRLMAVVRYETSNTLENRVLKHFLKLVIIESDRYLRQYGHMSIDKYDKLKSVRSLRNLARYTLKLPEFQNISNLYNVPQSNYVLRNNAMYKIIWDYYLLLLKKTKIVEEVWAHRSQVFADFVKVLFLAVNHDKAYLTSNIRHNLWIKSFPDGDGNCFTSDSWVYYDYDPWEEIAYRFLPRADSLRFFHRRWSGEIPAVMTMRVAFIPDNERVSDFFPMREPVLVYDESGENAKNDSLSSFFFITPSSGVADKIYELIKRVCGNG